jgi:hypothetical protein
MLDCRITYILNIKKHNGDASLEKKSTNFWVKTQNGRTYNRSLGVGVMILKERVREEDDSAHSSDTIKSDVGKL